MRSLMCVVLLMAVVLVLNWPSATVRCQAKSESVAVTSGDEAAVPRGKGWLVETDPEGHETATLWIYDSETSREIATYTVQCGPDGKLQVHVTIDQRFDGVKECWMWVLGN